MSVIKSRSPHGERGLKFNILTTKQISYESLPPRGAWIEIHPGLKTVHGLPVAPPTGSVD